MTDYVLKAEKGHIFISPIGFLTYAKDFYNASEAYISEKPFSPSCYYLVCRSLELSLKAYLLTEGIKRNKLKQKSLGHDLEKILRKCKELQLLDLVEISSDEQLN